jgi:hypothetical protein
MIWLSGRITGGHLLVVAWSAFAWLLLNEVLKGQRKAAYLGLGAWAGLGVYLDSMFVMTVGGMLVAALFASVLSKRDRKKDKSPVRDRGVAGHGLSKVLTLTLAFMAGAAPRAIGTWFDPYDAYHEQFAATLDPESLAAHARVLMRDCLPRLIAGHRLPLLEADPDPRLLGSEAPIHHHGPKRGEFRAVALLTTVLSLAFFAISLVALGWVACRGVDPVRRSLTAGILASSLAVTAAFLLNRNIFNADNYRYLVLFLVPWALGFGLVMSGCLRRPGLDRWLAVAAAIALAVLFTGDAAAWYRQLGWIDDRLVPIRRPLDEPALQWLADHPSVGSILGGYWDVYRFSFLAGGRVQGVPFAVFPNRFPEWSRDLPEGRPETLIARPTPDGRMFLASAIREGGKVLFRKGTLTIVHWPWPSPRPSR